MLSAPPPSDPGLAVAFEEALAGYHEGGLPIGASLFYRGELIGRVERDRDADEGLNPDVVAALDPQDGVPRDAGSFSERSLGKLDRRPAIVEASAERSQDSAGRLHERRYINRHIYC